MEYRENEVLCNINPQKIFENVYYIARSFLSKPNTEQMRIDLSYSIDMMLESLWLASYVDRRICSIIEMTSNFSIDIKFQDYETETVIDTFTYNVLKQKKKHTWKGIKGEVNV